MSVAGFVIGRLPGAAGRIENRRHLRYPSGHAMPRLSVNGTELYYETRGTGQPVLLIMGATGDAGHFDTIADLLRDEFTVVTYDRRGNGRSPAPAGWATTSPQEQADDAAGLLAALVRTPAVVVGTSSGAVFALCLLARHPAALRGAILHEPPVFALLDDPDAARVAMWARIGSALETGGPQTAIEPFWGYVAGEDAWDQLTPPLRERMRASSATLFGIELGTYEQYLPDEQTLAAVAPRVTLLLSARGLPPHAEAARRLGRRLARDVEITPGTHAAYHDHPTEFAQALRRLARQFPAMSPCNR
jgi:pimeloyl-ACP methyl ester carboxylesterase